MSDSRHLLSKRELADCFDVSLTTINNWLERGMPAAKTPDGSFADAYGFDLEAVVDWRRELAAQGRPQGGRALEEMPRDCWSRPDWDNGLRWLVEQGAWSFVWHWLHRESGLNLVSGLFVNAGVEPEAVQREIDLVVWSLLDGFTSWVTEDVVNRELIEQGGIDGLYRTMTGREIRTTPPRDPDVIQFQFPEWLLNAKGGATDPRETATTEDDPT